MENIMSLISEPWSSNVSVVEAGFLNFILLGAEYLIYSLI